MRARHGRTARWPATRLDFALEKVAKLAAQLDVNWRDLASTLLLLRSLILAELTQQGLVDGDSGYRSEPSPAA